jgi:hypothetical protein
VPARSGGRGHRGSPAPNTRSFSIRMDTRRVRGGGRVTPRWSRGTGAAVTVVKSSRAGCRGANLGGCGRQRGTTSRVAQRGVMLVSFCRGRRAVFAAQRAARHSSRVPAESRRRRKWAFGSASCPPRSRGNASLRRPVREILTAQTSRVGAWDAGRIGTAHPAPSGRRRQAPIETSHGPRETARAGASSWRGPRRPHRRWTSSALEAAPSMS